MAEDIKFTCPDCEQPLEAPADMAGESIDCPSCANTLDIPLPIAEFVDHSVPEPEPIPADPPPLPPAPSVRACPFCAEEILATAVKCKHCGEFLDGRQSRPQPVIKAKISRKSELAGEGCLLQGVGLVVIPAGFLFGWGAGLIVTVPLGIVLLLIGSRKASYPICSNCGMKLTGADVNMCPACKATFK